MARDKDKKKVAGIAAKKRSPRTNGPKKPKTVRLVKNNSKSKSRKT